MQVGFYGKLPSHGDFLRRRVSDAFVDAWDGWLRECLASSQTALGGRWLDVYLTSPAWRFACAAGACGPLPVLGVVAPSVDQVGRYFPLTLVAELPAETPLVSAASNSDRFFETAEHLVIETLATERVDFDRFDRRVAALEQELGALALPPSLALEAEATAILTDSPRAWHLPLGTSSDVRSAFEQLLSLHLESKYRPLVLWWSEGSAVVEPSCLIVKGLPPPTLYPAFLEGAWPAHQWQSLPTRVSGEITLSNTAAIEPAGALYLHSAAATDVGRARTNNEDGFVERPEAGIWAVADGMGGHSHGEVASRMVCDALAEFPLDGTFEEAVDNAMKRVQDVNDHLVRSSMHAALTERAGSTVVVLLVRGPKSAVLWAGDSRVYRWRGGTLEQLTRDHSLAELEGSNPLQSSVITRAVGMDTDLVLDVHRDSVLADDRFLLCSDGLTRVLTVEQIGTLMATPDIRAAVDGLIQATLDAGAPDNVTVLIAEVQH
ncbi:MAG TPA: type VI secretion system-associated protein TagF [Vicinamibacterales bacterium]|jgi:type VI secretion system protein ImpM